MKDVKPEIRKQDNIVQLIHSLTPAEKGYFKKFISTRTDRKNYEKLFDALDKTEHYDAENLSKKLGKSRKNLAHEKEYLLEVLMRALRNYHEKNPRVILHTALIESTILVDKNLPGLAQLKIDKTLAEARKGHHPYIALELLAGQREILRRTLKFFNPDYYATFLKNVEATREELAFLRTHIDLEELAMQISLYKLQRSFDRTEAEFAATAEWLKHSLLHQKFENPIFRIQQHSMISSLHVLSGNYAKAAEHIKSILVINVEHKDARILDSDGLGVCMSNYLTFLTNSGQFAEATRFMKEVENGCYNQLLIDITRLNFLITVRFPVARVTQYLMQLKQNNSVSRSEIENFIKHFDEKQQLLKKNTKSNIWLQVLFKIARIYFLMGDYDETSTRLWKLYQESDTDVDPHQNCIIRVAYAIVQAETGNFELMSSIVRSARSLFRKYKLNHQFEDTVLSFLLKLEKIADKKERLSAFRQLKAQYQLFEKDPLLKPELDMFEYKIWIDRNIDQYSGK